jgi:hypothetical protein
MVMTALELQQLAGYLSPDSQTATALTAADLFREKFHPLSHDEQFFEIKPSALQQNQLVFIKGWVAVANSTMTRKPRDMLTASIKKVTDDNKGLADILVATLDNLQAVMSAGIKARPGTQPSARLHMVMLDVIYLAHVFVLDFKQLQDGYPFFNPAPQPAAGSLQHPSTQSGPGLLQPAFLPEGSRLTSLRSAAPQHSTAPLAGLGSPAAPDSSMRAGTALGFKLLQDGYPPLSPSTTPQAGSLQHPSTQSGLNLLQPAFLPKGSRLTSLQSAAPQHSTATMAGLGSPAVPESSMRGDTVLGFKLLQDGYPPLSPSTTLQAGSLQHPSTRSGLALLQPAFLPEGSCCRQCSLQHPDAACAMAWLGWAVLQRQAPAWMLTPA